MSGEHTPEEVTSKSVGTGEGSAFLRTITENLFTKAAFATLDECYQQGQAAAGQAYRRDQNPYPTGEARREWWDAGWSNDYDELCGT